MKCVESPAPAAPLQLVKRPTPDTKPTYPISHLPSAASHHLLSAAAASPGQHRAAPPGPGPQALPDWPASIAIAIAPLKPCRQTWPPARALPPRAAPRRAAARARAPPRPAAPRRSPWARRPRGCGRRASGSPRRSPRRPGWCSMPCGRASWPPAPHAMWPGWHMASVGRPHAHVAVSCLEPLRMNHPWRLQPGGTTVWRLPCGGCHARVDVPVWTWATLPTPVDCLSALRLRLRRWLRLADAVDLEANLAQRLQP